jgi:AraC-like DNA-binding protein
MNLIAQFGLFNGILVLLLIIAYSFRRNRNKIFLGISIFFVWYSLLNLYLNATGLILQFPALLRTGLVAAFLAFPFLYIYSRNTFYPGKLWRSTDWILMLPALWYIIDLFPFFLMPANQKIAIWRENLANNKVMFQAREGWIGLSGFYFSFAYIWIGIIMFFQVRLIIRNGKLESGFKSVHNRRLLNFIVTITFLYLPLFLPGIFGVLFKLPWFNPRFIGFTYGLSLSAISIYLLIFPSILYGFLPEMKFSFPVREGSEKKEIPQAQSIPISRQAELEPKVLNEKINEESKVDQPRASDNELTPEVAIVLQHMTHNKPYLKQGFTIQDLSNQTEIPIYQLSPLINGYFKMNFVNWINRYRIEYFIEQVVEKQHMTLEALSREAGFVSRSTFISAFKKEKGTTPREYLKDLKLSA